MTCLRSAMVLGGFLMLVLLTTAETGQVKTTSLKIPPPGYSYMIKNNKALYNIKLVPDSTPDHQTDQKKFFNPYGRTRPSKTFFQLAKTRTEIPSVEPVESEKSPELNELSKNAEVKVAQVLPEEDESPEHESDEQSKEGDSEEDHESIEEDKEEEEEEEDSKEEDDEEDEKGSDEEDDEKESDEKESDEKDDEDSDEDSDKNTSTTVKSVQLAIPGSKSSSYFILGSSHRSSPNVQENTTKKPHHHHKAKVHSKGSHKKSHKSSKGPNKSSAKSHQLTKGSTRKNEQQDHKTRLPSTSQRSESRFEPSPFSHRSPTVKVDKRVGKPDDTPVVSAQRPSVMMRTGGPRITVAGTQHDFTRTGKALNRRSN